MLIHVEHFLSLRHHRAHLCCKMCETCEIYGNFIAKCTKGVSYHFIIATQFAYLLGLWSSQWLMKVLKGDIPSLITTELSFNHIFYFKYAYV